VITDGEIANANVAVLLQRSAARLGNAPCIVAPDGRLLWTFKDLAEAAARLAGGLVELGLGNGDRVLILEPDARELYRVVVGVIWAGALAAIPPMSLPLRGALTVAAASRPQAVAASIPLWPLALSYAELRNAPVRLTNGRWRFFNTASVRALSGHQPIAPQAASAQTPALLSFTSGTTGPATVVTRTHGVLQAQHDALMALRPLRETDRDFAGLPLLVLHNLGAGVTSVLAPRGPGSRKYGRRVREALVRSHATSAAGFPHLFESAVLGARPGELDGIRSIYVGGNRVRAGLLAALKTVAPAAAVTVVYGSTEIEPISAIDGDEYLDLLAGSDPADGTCVGMVVDGLRLRVEPLSDVPLRSPAGSTTGRILLSGPAASGQMGAGEWVDTGDAGRVDAVGRLWLLGRTDNIVGNLYPAQVERVIETLPWVRPAALVRVASGPRAQAVLAVQPFRWGTQRVRAEQLAQLTRFRDELDWPLHDILLLRRLPVSTGAAAKVDFGRLRKLATSRSRRAPTGPGPAGDVDGWSSQAVPSSTKLKPAGRGQDL
jgi:acyl-coenzyme A synthetase/AMP-(fatty) acid ligase